MPTPDKSSEPIPVSTISIIKLQCVADLKFLQKLASDKSNWQTLGPREDQERTKKGLIANLTTYNYVKFLIALHN